MPYSKDSPFIHELAAEAQTLESGGEIMTVNGSPMGRAIWNLICSKRDVKRYFGIKGTGKNLLYNFMELFVDVMGDEE